MYPKVKLVGTYESSRHTHHDTNPQRSQNQVHKKMTKDPNYEGSSQQSKEDLISRRNGQGP